MLCLLAKNCTEAAYTRLVEALCTEHNIMLMKVSIVGTRTMQDIKDQKLFSHFKFDSQNRLGWQILELAKSRQLLLAQHCSYEEHW